MATHKSSPGYSLLIKELLANPLSQTPDQVIVSAGSGRYSYATFYQRLMKMAGALQGLGVKQGDVVAVMDWDCHRYLECFFGIPMIGATLHTINVRLAPEQILYTINHAKDDVILAHADFLPLLEELAPRFERPMTIIPMVPSVAASSLTVTDDYESLLNMAADTLVFPDFDENTIATTFYTTGTTGDPKGVRYSHRQLMLHTQAAMAAFGTLAGPCRLTMDDVYMPITPMFHVHAWGFPFVATVAGLKQVYPGRYDPATLLKRIVDEKVTFSHCVPTILQMLLAAPEAADVDLSGWKVIIGGSAMPHGLAQAALDRGIEVFTAYGMSETCPLLTVARVRAGDGVAERCSTGQAVPMVDLRVVDAEMQDVPRDNQTTGEVVARAPWLTDGYVGNESATTDLWRGGYLHTGDVGVWDRMGTLTITDRLKDVIKSGGEWLSSLQLENIASTAARVAEVAAVGIADERWGERPMLLVVAQPSDEPMDAAGVIEEVRTAIRKEQDIGALPAWAMPERIEIVAALPKTSVGKLDKKTMRIQYA